MKHLKFFGVCVVAAFALIAVAAAGSAAAAEPEWGHCEPIKSKGHFEDSNCSKEDFKENKAHERKYKGHFEWYPGASAACFGAKKGHYEDSACTKEDFKENSKTHEKKYKGHFEKTGGPNFTGLGGAGVLEFYSYACALTNEESSSEEPGSRVPHEDCQNEEVGFHGEIGPIPVECASENATGEATGSDEVANVSVRFKNCSSDGLPATTSGLPTGEIQVNPLKGQLGYINKSAHQVGILLEPAAAGGQFAEFEVEAGELIVHVGVGNATEGAFYEEAHGAPTGNDGIISPIVPVDQMTHTFTQNYRIEEIGPYLALSCPISHTCPLGSEDVLENGKGDLDLLNIPSHFEGGPREALETHIQNTRNNHSDAWSPAGQEITNMNTLEGDAEIKG